MLKSANGSERKRVEKEESKEERKRKEQERKSIKKKIKCICFEALKFIV